MSNSGTGPSATSDLSSLVNALLDSYRSDARGHHINRRYLPSRDETITIVRILLQILYPGYFGRQDLKDSNVEYHVGVLVSSLREKLERQVEQCLCYGVECEEVANEHGEKPEDERSCAPHARSLTNLFLRRIPELRKLLISDMQAAFDGDPAAFNLDEVILSYPGLLAVTVYRIAHEFYAMGVPIMPRIMTEWAHTQTGADIHPGATIGPSFFLDHATGAVIGETTRIGAHAKLYQGVTLGALSLPNDAGERITRGVRRHPTVEDHVTVYANATVLGADTVLGEGSIVGGSAFVTNSVPRGGRVAVSPDVRVRDDARSEPDRK